MPEETAQPVINSLKVEKPETVTTYSLEDSDVEEIRSYPRQGFRVVRSGGKDNLFIPTSRVYEAGFTEGGN